MFKKLVSVITLLALLPSVLLFSPSTVSAVTYAPTASPSASASPKPTEVNSFDLFWPMVSGKTKESKLYFLKRLKENVRGMFIFAPALKSDYQVFLAVKRMLEAEILLKANNTDLANQTISDASKNIDSAINNTNNVKKEDFSPVSGQMIDRMSKLQTLIDWLVVKNSNSKTQLESLKSKILSLDSKIK